MYKFVFILAIILSFSFQLNSISWSDIFCNRSKSKVTHSDSITKLTFNNIHNVDLYVGYSGIDKKGFIVKKKTMRILELPSKYAKHKISFGFCDGKNMHYMFKIGHPGKRHMFVFTSAVARHWIDDSGPNLGLIKFDRHR